MIKLTRRRTPAGFPARLHGKGHLTLKLQLVEAERRRQKDPGVRHEFDADVWPRAKKILKQESANKCAYCEAPTATVTHGDVEHYRPKSIYWWLVYCMDNYLYSCQICNQIYKSDNFPISGKPLAINPPFPDPFPATIAPSALEALARRLAPDPLDDTAGQPIATFRKLATREKAGIPDPYLVDPETLFKWEADEVNGEVWLRARSKTVASRRAYEAVDRYLGINREELRRQRYETYEFARVLSLSLGSIADKALAGTIRSLLVKMMAEKAAFAGMARYFIREVWRVKVD